MPKRCACLTMRDVGDFVTDYSLTFAPMADLGWAVERVAWRDAGIDWNAYDAVYICAPWDYPLHFDEFATVLETIDRSTARLVNDLALVRWNLIKTYLRDLQSRGAAIVPSLWPEHIDATQVATWFDTFGTDKLVIKPVVGANALHTYVLQRPVSDTSLERLVDTFGTRAFFVQPFVPAVTAEGEYSLVFFGSDFSHAILKVPQTGDFRVQEEHGATINSAAPPAGLIETARKVIELVTPAPVYARADFVRGTDDQFWLMELELIEPSLYLRTDAQAPARFAAAFDGHISRFS